MIVDAKLYRDMVDYIRNYWRNPCIECGLDEDSPACYSCVPKQVLDELRARIDAAEAPKPDHQRMSAAQFNNRYVRSNRGDKAEVAGSSKDVLRGTNDDQPCKVAQPQ